MMHGGMIARGEVKSASISAVITRADGTVERLGTISYHHRNPIINALGNLLIRIKRGNR